MIILVAIITDYLVQGEWMLGDIIDKVRRRLRYNAFLWYCDHRVVVSAICRGNSFEV